MLAIFMAMLLYYLVEENHQAVVSTASTEKYLGVMTALFFVPAFYFYDSLNKLAINSHAGYSNRNQPGLIYIDVTTIIGYTCCSITISGNHNLIGYL